MHPRHRNSVAAYNRSNSMGMGGVGRGAPSRISPEGSMRGHEMYNSEYRNYNRDGFGRGQSRHFPLQQPSPQRSDVFMEAGKMAAEYLIGKGVLPQSVLLGKLQNGNLRNLLGFRAQEGDDMRQPMGSRSSALSRLGNNASDGFPGRRRYPDEYGAFGSKDYIRDRRRNGSFKDSGWDQDFGNRSWSDRSRASPDTSNHHDLLEHQGEKKITRDSYGESQKSSPTKIIQETDSASNTAMKASDNIASKDLQPQDDEVESVKMFDNMETSVAESGQAKNDNDKNNNNDNNQNDDDDEHEHDVLEQKSTKDDSHVKEKAQTCKKGTDLLSLCKFEKIPTRTRSSLTVRSSKIVRDEMVEETDKNESVHPIKSESLAEDMPLDASIQQNQDIKPLGSDSASTPAAEEGKNVVHAVEENSTADDTVFGNCSAVERGEKRALEDDNVQKQNKKPRELTSSDDLQSDFVIYRSDFNEKKQNSNESKALSRHTVVSPEHNTLVGASLLPNTDLMQSAEFEEKQLFPGSFKTCDLNLMESSDMNDNHDADLIFPSIAGSGKQPAPIDFDLSISNSCNSKDKYKRSGFDGKDIEVIDLDNDSDLDTKAFNNQLGSSVTGFTGCDGFPNNAHNVNEIADVQDGYGLMISELLGNDMPNCSSVPGDLNALNNDMGLHNGEGILGDDDSIYMSLGEIPIGFLRGGWEQPSQDFGKPF